MDINMSNEQTALNTGPTPMDFTDALRGFVAWYQHFEENRYANADRLDGTPLVTAEPGSKYIRIVISRYGSHSSACFVRKSDGAILKCAGWKRPFIATGGPDATWTIRGSIFNPASFDPARWA